MIKQILYFILSIIAISAVTNCKKYSEGPKFTLRTVKHRLSGAWKLTRFEVDGIDSLADMETNEFLIGSRYTKDKSTYPGYDLYTRFGPLNGSYNRSLVYLGLDKESLFFCNEGQTKNFVTSHLKYKNVFVSGDTADNSGFKILKLTNSELKSCSFKTAVLPYTIEFKRI